MKGPSIKSINNYTSTTSTSCRLLLLLVLRFQLIVGFSHIPNRRYSSTILSLPPASSCGGQALVVTPLPPTQQQQLPNNLVARLTSQQSSSRWSVMSPQYHHSSHTFDIDIDDNDNDNDNDNDTNKGGGEIRDDQHRRQFLLKSLTKSAAATSSSILLVLSTTTASHAAVAPPPAAAESIRRAASRLPGYGQADIYYPPFYRGRWRVTRDILVSSEEEGDGGDPMLKGVTLPLTLDYDVRFIAVEGDTSSTIIAVEGDTTTNDSSDGGGGGGTKGDDTSYVIADRQFNEKSYYDALVRSTAVNTNNTIKNRSSPPPIQTTTWSSSNPNVLTISYVDQSSKEVRVTKRATEIVDLEGGIVSSSEFRRVVTVSSMEGGRGGIPSVGASRVLTKWKKGSGGGEENDVLDGIEVVYSEGGVMGDPMGGGVGGGRSSGNGPQLTLKSRLRLVRIRE